MSLQVPVRSLLFCVAAAVVLGAGLAQGVGLAEAQEAAPTSPAREPTRAERAEARSLFEQAGVAIQEGRFASARDLLRRSLALVPNAGAAFNLAVALRGTGQLLDAIRTFDALLASEYGALSSAQGEQAETLRTAARRELAHLEVVALGAPVIEVRLDGELVGETPDGGTLSRDVDPGEHVVTATAPRRTPYEEHVTLASGGRVVVRAELGATLAGTLVVESSSAEAIVEIEGVARGRGTVQRELPPGEYRVSVHDGERSDARTVRVESGALVRVALSADDGGGSIVESPWLWAGVGAVVVGTVLAIVIPLTVVQEAPPIVDPTYGVIATLTVPLP